MHRIPVMREKKFQVSIASCTCEVANGKIPMSNDKGLYSDSDEISNGFVPFLRCYQPWFCYIGRCEKPKQNFNLTNERKNVFFYLLRLTKSMRFDRVNKHKWQIEIILTSIFIRFDVPIQKWRSIRSTRTWTMCISVMEKHFAALTDNNGVDTTNWLHCVFAVRTTLLSSKKSLRR